MIGSDIIAYILAGGGSRRMGVDKLFLHIEGLSLLERTIAVCEASFSQVRLVSGKPGKLASLGYPVVVDNPLARGPMGGVIAALRDCPDDCCFITAADLLDLRPEIISSLTDQYDGQQYLGMLESGGLQPLCGIYHKSALDVICRFAEAGEFSMKKAVTALRHGTVALPAGRWRNINSPEDLAMGGLNG